MHGFSLPSVYKSQVKVCVHTNFSSLAISILRPLWLIWSLGTCVVETVWSAEDMKALRVVVTTLDLVKPPRPLGRTELMENGVRLKVSFLLWWYLQQDQKDTTNDVILKMGIRRPFVESVCMNTKWNRRHLRETEVLTSSRCLWRPRSGQSCSPRCLGSVVPPLGPLTCWKLHTGSGGVVAAQRTSPTWLSSLYLWQTSRNIMSPDQQAAWHLSLAQYRNNINHVSVSLLNCFVYWNRWTVLLTSLCFPCSCCIKVLFHLSTDSQLELVHLCVAEEDGTYKDNFRSHELSRQRIPMDYVKWRQRQWLRCHKQQLAAAKVPAKAMILTTWSFLMSWLRICCCSCVSRISGNLAETHTVTHTCIVQSCLTAVNQLHVLHSYQIEL